MAEQAINTVYLLGEQPDAFCGEIIKSYTRKVFTDSEQSIELSDLPADSTMPEGDGPALTKSAESSGNATTSGGDSFLLSQLVFLVGHVAFKHIVYFELVERELKRRKELQAKGTYGSSLENIEHSLHRSDKGASTKGRISNTKDVDELEQVAGSAEDDTADRIAKFCDDDMLYGDKSLLALFGPMMVHICATPKMYKVC